eukprot:6473704-Pyramimonas_sp.AAC.1
MKRSYHRKFTVIRGPQRRKLKRITRRICLTEVGAHIALEGERAGAITVDAKERGAETCQ